jgi:hypothetical protein
LSPNDLLTFTRKKPFEPFRLLVTDGTTYDIRHPEFCMVLQTSVIVGVPGSPAGNVPERAEWIDARHIVKVIPLAQSAPGGDGGAPSNGPPGSA